MRHIILFACINAALLGAVCLGMAKAPDTVPSPAYPHTSAQPASAQHESFSQMRDVPEHLSLTWGQEPIVELTPTSGEVVLNGLWKFQPGYDPSKLPEDRAWTWLQVPGSWGVSWNKPHVTVRGEGDLWNQFGDGREVGIGWYERPFWVPSEWKGRRVTIDFDRISTDSEVYVNGIKCGVTNWPGGVVDITDAVRFGAENDLRVKVLAIGDEREVVQFMGTEAGHNSAPKKAKLTIRGIISDVVLKSQAPEPSVRAIGIRTSVRDEEMRISFRVDEDSDPTAWEYAVRVTELDGSEVKRWSVNERPTQDEYGRWQFSIDWADPTLWEVDNPHLYYLNLSIQNGDEQAVYSERFGFREFWVEGRDFYLNGTLFRLRPSSHGFTDGYYPGIPELIHAEIDGYLSAGYNIKQIWPTDFRQRGRHDYSSLYATIADERGMAMMAPVASFAGLVNSWDRDGVQERWFLDLVDDIERMQNHPSVLIWATSANRFGHGDDQNPMRIGQKTRGPEQDAGWAKGFQVAEAGTAAINAFDPSRPVLIHQGSSTGNIYGTNTYLNLQPLQEREEWLSEWASSGDMPYIAVEFGSPLDASFMRGRFGGHNAGISEFLMTEHAADYLGARAYALEDADYRADVQRRNFSPLTNPDWHAARTVNDEAAFQEVASLFVENTWRSWRTWGISGGMIAWTHAGGIQNDWSGGYNSNYRQVEKPTFIPGTRGVHFFKDHLPEAAMYYLQAEGNTLLPSFLSLQSHNQDALAYIGGKPGEWVEKGHHFLSEEVVEKQAVLINDTREEQTFKLSWRVELQGTVIESGAAEGSLAVGDIFFEPFSAALPEVVGRQNGVVSLVAQIGDRRFEDSFDFRVYPELEQSANRNRVVVFDPSGETLRYLAELGFSTEVFRGDWSGLEADDIFVVGEKAMVAEKGLPLELFEFVESGGNVLMLAQPRKWLEQNTSFRVAGQVSRRYWPVGSSNLHPVLAGLDGEDLRDWRGSGSVQPDRLNVGLLKDSFRATPVEGWHWGNRGSVASVAIEKPHNSGWAPLIEGDFGLNYSPLMELQGGAGRFILSGLDLVNRGELNPVGDLLTSRLIQYLDTPHVASASRGIAYSGGEDGYRFLQQAGFEPAAVNGRPEDGQLWLADAGVSPDFRHLKDYADAGGNVLVLQASAQSLPQGVEVAAGEFGIHPSVPEWDVLHGVSVSDLHLRFNQTVNLLSGDAAQFDIGAGGMLGRYQGQGGAVVYLQLHPSGLTEEYLRLSNWGYTRLLTQIMSNLGAQNRNDFGALVYQENVYAPISLAKDWRVKDERLLDAAVSFTEPNVDTGNEGVGLGWHQPDFDDSDWYVAKMPQEIELATPEFKDKDGAFWLRAEVDIPEEWEGQELQLNLRRLDDFDITYFNGNRVGATNKTTPNAFNVIRQYRVSPWMFKPGRNVIAIRVFDHFGGGGIMEKDPTTLNLSLVNQPEELGPYVPGFRKDRKNGDDPFRYYRW